MAVDHDHNTGKPRALLCYTCNKALGWWEFDPIAAHNAATYIAGIARDYGDTYDPMPHPLVEPRRPSLSRLLVPIALPPRKG